ncbi:HU family DNA-binding protein [uncultured Polaribacter sp.]|uniref:HU family DNA-binding protein n=1 Tax=uncultured Polaribacter sp. TaxID=174711 RepID=UPI0026083602|nr:HU family DNA-binding protein [uncultured Polaribacter sp.]
MPIKFKAIERGEPGVPGGGTKKWYATVVNDQRASLKELTLDIERISTVNRADILAVLSALVQLIPEKLTNSTIVAIGDLGYFRISLKSTGEASAEEVDRNSIVRSRIIFTPGKDFKNAQQIATYQKVT